MIVCANSLALPLADRSIDLIVTSPQYNLDIPYATPGDYWPYRMYLENFVTAMAIELSRVARNGGRLCLNLPLDTSKGDRRPVYADYLKILEEAGWIYQTTIVWNEQNVSKRTAWGSFMSPSAPFVTAPVEMILVMYKDHWRRGKAGTSSIAREDFIAWTLGHWTFSGESPRRVGHPAPFPEELPRRLVQLYSFVEDRVLDPFGGSGTTLKVCQDLGRSCVSVDLDYSYCQLSAKRAGAADAR